MCKNKIDVYHDYEIPIMVFIIPTNYLFSYIILSATSVQFNSGQVSICGIRTLN